MKKLFNAIKKHDIDTVKKILENKPNLITCVAKQPPKADDGKSLLQIAIKDGTIEIANYLLDKGADVNFIEEEMSASGWRMPVIQDTLSNAIMKTRWCAIDLQGHEKVQHSKEESDEAFFLLKRMVDLGAALNVADSKGNTTIERAAMQAAQIMPLYNAKTQQYTEKRKITDDFRNDLTRIFALLFENGLTSDTKMRTSNMTVKDFYAKHPLGEFLAG